MLKNSMKALARLTRFGRGGAVGVVSFASAHALNQPLMVEPGIGQNLLNAFLSGEGEAAGGVRVTQEAVIAVLDISGALLSREEVGPCGETPASYEGIGKALDALVADPAVTAIVLRLNSPGGMASQLFDLTDRIYEARQQKRIVAAVDDMAYSACYALAAACGEIWVSRTGGVGSVGVVSYHVDQSGWNEKTGVAVEYIYAGAHKIDGNPHSALSEHARAAYQEEVNRLYDLFTSSVSRYLGVSVDTVKATEAGLFFGEKAIAAGLAHKLGTFRDVLASLSATAIPGPAAASASANDSARAAARVEPVLALGATADVDASHANAEAASDAPSVQAEAETLQDVATAAVAAGLGELCAIFLSEGMSTASARSRLDTAREIRNLCAAAGAPHLSAKFALEGRDVEWVRSQLVSARVREDDNDIVSLHGDASGLAAATIPSLNRAEIFARRNSSSRTTA